MPPPAGSADSTRCSMTALPSRCSSTRGIPTSVMSNLLLRHHQRADHSFFRVVALVTGELEFTRLCGREANRVVAPSPLVLADVDARAVEGEVVRHDVGRVR